MFEFFKKLFSKGASETKSKNQKGFDDFFEANKGKVVDFSSLDPEKQRELQEKIGAFMNNTPADESIKLEDLTFELKQIHDKKEGQQQSENTTTFQRIGLDTGLFVCRDMGNFVQVLSPGHIKHLNITSDEAVDIAMKNFWNKHSKNLKVIQLRWENVYALSGEEGGLEANNFVMGHLAVTIMEQYNMETMELMAPFRNNYIFSPKFSKEVLLELKEVFQERYDTEVSKRVSAYVYRLVDPPRWEPYAKLFD